MEWLEIISVEAAGSETKKIVELCNAINVPQSAKLQSIGSA
jgi:hypothetical protein